jgi:hypothetical protein
VSALHIPTDLAFVGYSDDDEGWGATIEDYVQNHNSWTLPDADPDLHLKVGDEFTVDAIWSRSETWRIAPGPSEDNPDAPLMFERVEPKAT